MATVNAQTVVTYAYNGTQGAEHRGKVTYVYTGNIKTEATEGYFTVADYGNFHVFSSGGIVVTGNPLDVVLGYNGPGTGQYILASNEVKNAQNQIVGYVTMSTFSWAKIAADGVPKNGTVTFTFSALPTQLKPQKWDLSFRNMTGTDAALQLVTPKGVVNLGMLPGNDNPNGTETNVDHTVEGFADVEGGNWSLKLNNKVIMSGSIPPVTDPEAPRKPIIQFGGMVNAGGGTNTPPEIVKPTTPPIIPTTTKPPTSTPPPAGPPGQPGRGGTSSGGANGNGDVNVMNTNDFYDPFKKALDDWGNASKSTGEIINATTMTQVPEVTDRMIPDEKPEGPQLVTDTEAKGKEAVQKAGDVVDQVISKLPTAPTMIGASGRKYAYAIPFPKVGWSGGSLTSGTSHYVLDLSRYSDFIEGLRELIKMFMVFAFWIATVRTIRGSMA